jgi:hypothetical protein
MNEYQASVLNQLELNKPKTRFQIVKDIQSNERSVRYALKALRLENEPIASYSSGKGYWLTDNPGEIMHTTNEFGKRSRDEAEMEAAGNITAINLAKEREGYEQR